jgi:cullin 1
MISKLKEACGFEHTNKLQRMFAGNIPFTLDAKRLLTDLIDMSLSKDLTDSFKDCMGQNYNDMDINFSIMVLGTNFWPLSPPKVGWFHRPN